MSTGRQSPDLAEVISRLSKEAAVGASLSETRDAAARTGGVPVHTDLGGVLVVAPDGSVLHYNPESCTVNVVLERGWRVLALVKAAAKFPELRGLRPARPSTAVTCTLCGGHGVILGGADCGLCFGSGWTVDSSPGGSHQG
jgi:hypothetical protein